MAPVVRLDRAPPLDDLSGLDPEAVELVRHAASELDAAVGRPERWTRLAAVLHAHGRFGLARECYEQGLIRDDGDARAWFLLSIVEDELGEVERAIASLERCLRIEPSRPTAHWRLGALRLGRGELAQAEAAMAAALALAPGDAAAVVGMARVELQQGAFEAAAARLEEHLRRHPQDAHGRFLLGTAYRGLGRKQAAEQALAGASGAEPLQEDPWLAEVLALRRGHRADFLRAMERLERGHLEPAIAALEALQGREPRDTLVLLGLHRAYRLKGELERAIELLLEARRIDPRHEMVHLHLAGAYLESARGPAGDLDRSRLESALASASLACESSPTLAAAHGMRGDVLEALGRAAEAADAWARAAALDRGAALWQEKGGRALVQLGRWAEAVPLLQRLDVLQPDSARVLLHLAAALANSGRLAEACAPLERARALAPEDALIQKAVRDLERSLADAPGGGDSE